MTELDADSYNRLAAATVTQAYRDALKGDPDAVDWLKSTGLTWAGAVMNQLPEDLQGRLHDALETNRRISRSKRG